MKDFAKSYEQRRWQSAVAEYDRMHNWINSTMTERSKDYARGRIAQLEKEYPTLSK